MRRPWVWFATTSGRPDGAWASATAAGPDAGWLAVWEDEERPVEGALRADRRLFDPAGAPALVSLSLAGGRHVLFDDPAVQRARQLVLEDPRLGAMTTLSASSSHLGGALVLARGPEAEAVLATDPFARVLAARRLAVGPGLLGAPAPPAGPVLERYAGAPWPVDRF